MFGGSEMMSNRHERHTPSQCVTCAGQSDRHERHTPLGGVTIVTLAQMVPMPPFMIGGVTDSMTFHSTHTGGLAHG